MHNNPIRINPLHHHYETNTIGRDFVVGDLQGCYDELMGALKCVNFDRTIDRLFCVGDLIDRGPKSLECAKLIYEPWFHSTLGNHEQMMIMSRLQNRQDYHDMWIDSGGLWHVSEEKWLVNDIAESFVDLPLIISIGNGENRFNVVHAEILRMDRAYGNYLTVNDRDIDDWTFNNFDIHDMLWGRHFVDIRTPKNSYVLMDIDSKKPYQSDQLSLTYVGHSIVPGRPVQIERQIYLDTGMVNYHKPNNESWRHRCVLTLACPQEEMFYVYNLPWRTTIKYPYSQMRKYT